jgi:L-idonate 5-dehydrogenase
MKAAVIHAARDLRLDDRPDPEMHEDEVMVRLGAGGICGSDLSYWGKGRVGDFALKEPLVLGHEIAGEVIRVGAAVRGLMAGDHVAVDPSRPCLACDYCRAGRSNLCRNMRFFGSAAVFPHVQGAFAEIFVCRGDQCVPVPRDMPFRKVALAEPLSVAIHGVRRAGELVGRRVLVAGAGPIGMLLAIAARRVGASYVAITDLARREADKGWFDVALEATGAPAALASLFRVVRPGGRVVQLGMMPPGDVPVPANMLMAREIDFVGAFRFGPEFQTAVDWLVQDLIDVGPVMSADLPMTRLEEAFQLAADRRRAIKVHLHF